MTKLKPRLKQALFVALSLFVMTAPAVLAYSFRAPITLSNTSATSYTMLPVIVTVNNTYLAANGFLGSSGLDSRVETLGGATKPHLVADNKTLFASVSAAGSQTNLNYTTGSSNLSAFDIITGYGGYVTIADSANQEMASNFTKTYTNLYLYGNGNIDTKFGAYDFYKSGTNVKFRYSGTVNPTNAGNTTSTFGAPVSSVNFTLPSGIAQKDIIVSLLTTAAASARTYPDGWTQLFTGTNTVQTTGYYKVADGTESGNVLVQLGGATTGGFITYTVRGALNLEVATATGTSTNADPPAITPSWGGLNNLYIAVAGLNNTVSAAPATYSNFLNAGNVLASAEKATNTSPENPGVFTSLVANWVSATIAFRPAQEITVAAVADGLYSTATVQADSVNVWATVGSLASANASIVAIANNANNIILMSNATPYLGSYTLSVGGNQQVRYEPNAIISGTTLPDRGSDATNNAGVITWGANPASVTATIGAMISSTQTVEGTTTTETPSEILPATPGTAMNTGTGTAVPAILQSNPFRGLITFVSVLTKLTEMQAWRWFGLLIVLLVAVVSLVYVKNHLGIVSIAVGVTIAALTVFQIWPWYALLASAICLLWGIVSERTPSYG